MQIKTDVLIIGSGIAGLFLAKKTAEAYPELSVVVVTKNTPSESNTFYAQGGIATVYENQNDTIEKHIEDTFLASDGTCDRNVVEMVIKKAKTVLDELLGIGVEFDRDESGSYHLAREGGHSESRIFHKKDQTGKELEEKMLLALHHLENLRIISHCTALELITNGNTCEGLWAYQSIENQLIEFCSKVVIIAAGGAGQVYSITTNPAIATGDGVAMAYRAKATIRDIELVQFHPTAFYEEADEHTFLISEAVRGAGALLRNEKGEYFMEKYHLLKDLAPRDIVSRAISSEINKSKKACVYLDCSSIGQEKFAVLFPHIYQSCFAKGIVPGRDLIPVAPAAHYFCGGVETGVNGETAVKNLYACGESARTGMHGANRLASNSLLEALVFAGNIFESFAKVDFSKENKIQKSTIEFAETDNPKVLAEVSDLKREIQHLMTKNAGIVKTNSLLSEAQKELVVIGNKIGDLPKNPQWYELRNIYQIASLIISHSIARKQNAGVYFNKDLVNLAV
ncbi:MAG: L-aspartate oxidase [Chitinophagaceae bacterium]|nr:MAG: L-aspartate oxidase [Chitinophagaceae bacterium]